MIVSDELLEKLSKLRGLYDTQAIITHDHWLILYAKIFGSIETEGNTDVVDNPPLKSTVAEESSIDTNKLQPVTPAIATRDPSNGSTRTPESKYGQIPQRQKSLHLFFGSSTVVTKATSTQRSRTYYNVAGESSQPASKKPILHCPWEGCDHQTNHPPALYQHNVNKHGGQQPSSLTRGQR
eukprot:6673674-Pyramimonas_sp.AAC.1